MSVNPDDIKKLNKKIWDRGYVDREHLTEFLTLVPTSDGPTIIREVKAWLKALQDDPKFDKINFPHGDIDAIISDLDSYGRVQPQTLYEFKQNSNKVIGVT